MKDILTNLVQSSMALVEQDNEDDNAMEESDNRLRYLWGTGQVVNSNYVKSMFHAQFFGSMLTVLVGM